MVGYIPHQNLPLALFAGIYSNTVNTFYFDVTHTYIHVIIYNIHTHIYIYIHIPIYIYIRLVSIGSGFPPQTGWWLWHLELPWCWRSSMRFITRGAVAEISDVGGLVLGGGYHILLYIAIYLYIH